jgi:hypothetical protein
MNGTFPLGDVAHISAGFSIAGAMKHDPAGAYQVILPRHIDDGGRPFAYDDERHAMRMSLSSRADKYLVQPGDVLFISRGERNRSVAVHSCPPRSVTPTTFFTVRPRTQVILSDYLAWYLNQVPAQIAIAQARTGAGTPMVQRALFARIPIRVPPISHQRAIVGLNNAMLSEHDIVHRLDDALTRRNRLIGERLAKNS